MKKLIACILILTMALGMAACSGSSTDTDVYEGTMTDLMNGIYEKVTVEMMLMEPTAVDLTDASTVTYYTGLSDGTALSEAVFSEPMMSSQAYSLVAMRVAEGSDVEETANQVLAGADPIKWLCVTADDVRVLASGDVILLIMVDSSLISGDDIAAAFTELVGEPQVTLTK